MLFSLSSLISALRAVDLSSASPVQVKAIGGLASLLYPYTEQVYPLLDAVSKWSTDRFAQAATDEESELWLDVLLHFTPSQYLFSHIFDDDEAQALYDKADLIEARWLETIRPLLDCQEDPFAGLSLSDRLFRLLCFCRQDINTLSAGNDEKASLLLSSAHLEFTRCHSALFPSSASVLTPPSSLLLPPSSIIPQYYPLLTTLHPDPTSPSSVRYYRDYFRDFNENFPSEQDELYWSFCEIQWHHRLTLDAHDDQTALSSLWLAQPEACAAFRCQLYKWYLELDPYDDDSIQAQTRHSNYISEGIRRLDAWLEAKQKAGIPIPDDRLADLLTTYALARLTLPAFDSLEDYLDLHAYDILSRLQPSKLKTHFKARLAILFDDDDLLSEAHSELSVWSPSSLTPEDHYLLESFCPKDLELSQ